MRNTETAEVLVAIRKRPLNLRELANKERDVVRVESKGSVNVIEERYAFCDVESKLTSLKYSSKPCIASTMPSMRTTTTSSYTGKLLVP